MGRVLRLTCLLALFLVCAYLAFDFWRPCILLVGNVTVDVLPGASKQNPKQRPGGALREPCSCTRAHGLPNCVNRPLCWWRADMGNDLTVAVRVQSMKHDESLDLVRPTCPVAMPEGFSSADQADIVIVDVCGTELARSCTRRFCLQYRTEEFNSRSVSAMVPCFALAVSTHAPAVM